MRIVAGELARRTLLVPKGNTTRPTTDRVRESLFQHLEIARLPGGFEQLRVLDLFAGSGALAFEAVSRGAASATLVEADKEALSAIRANVEILGLAPKVRVLAGRIPGVLKRASGPFDLVFADPPYAEAPLRPIARELGRLAGTEALFVYEHSSRSTPAPLEGWTPPETRAYGDTHVSFYQRVGVSG